MTQQVLLANVPRYDVEACDLKVIDDVVAALNQVGVGGYQRLLMSFEGFDNDARLAYEIQEIRLFVSAVFEKYPHFSYYLEPASGNLILILACMGSVEPGDMMGNPTGEHVVLEHKMLRRMTDGLSRFGIDSGDTLGTVVVSEFLKKYFMGVKS